MQGMRMSKAIRLNGKKIKRLARRPWLLYLFLLPLFFSVAASLFEAEYGRFLVKLGLFALFAGSVTLIDRGLREGYRYEEAVISKAPFPYRSVGALTLGITVFLLAFLVDGAGIFRSLFLAVLTGAGVLLDYGLDPRRDKLPQNSGVEPELLLKSLNEAEATLAEIVEAKEEIRDPRLEQALDHAVANAREILDTLKADPRDIRVARKFLVVYLEGIRTVIRQYNDLDSGLIDESIRMRLLSLLEEAKLRFEKELERLRSNDLFDLDVQIDALKEQLKH